MDQSRPDLSNNPQQNVHLYMHHVCACQNLYPSTYYPTINYRTPSLISYTATPPPPPPPVASVAPSAPPPPPPPPPSVVSNSGGGGGGVVVSQPQTTTRPYLQHYQYTQYNVGNQYNLPTAQLANHCNSGCSSSSGVVGGGEIVMLPSQAGGGGGGSNCSNIGECGDSQEPQQSQAAAATPPPPPTPLPEFEYGLTIPPMNDFFVMNNGDDMEMNTDNFIKFLERSCLLAENIAYKNRARPCFRNIQNLCIRTRTEILKQRTTLANLRSQGIPWATKDFIYAFIRLINCWHILKGYWENRNLINLNKIEKQLTTTFKTCYMRWERETCQLATELTRIFYNLDFNQNNTNNFEQTNKTASTTTTTSLVEDLKKTTNETTMTDNNGAASSETVDQANQTNFDNDTIDDDNNSIVYIKSGNYFVPSKNCKNNKDATTVAATTTTATTTTTTTPTNPCVIEFLETAQNIDKGIEAMNDKYRIKLESLAIRKISETTTTRDDLQPNNNTADDNNETEVDWWSSE